jgi:[NiFe] hydrogenase diaphorase moiety small subunit
MNSKTLRFSVDGVPVEAEPGQTIIAACDDAGIYIPRLCYRADLPPGGQCRLCTCKVHGRPVAACVTPVTQAMVVENDTPELQADRKTIVEMLFVEGNHPCPFCEKSGNCDLQAMGYRFGLPAMQLTYQFPKREIDATHPQIFLDRNTCILCGLCIRASQHADGKSVFGFENRGAATQLAVNSTAGLAGTDLDAADRAASVCPVACIVVKRTGYETPYGDRTFDERPIGTDIESKLNPALKAPSGTEGHA